jgi:hypothetical protein
MFSMFGGTADAAIVSGTICRGMMPTDQVRYLANEAINIGSNSALLFCPMVNTVNVGASIEFKFLVLDTSSTSNITCQGDTHDSTGATKAISGPVSTTGFSSTPMAITASTLVQGLSTYDYMASCTLPPLAQCVAPGCSVKRIDLF